MDQSQSQEKSYIEIIHRLDTLIATQNALLTTQAVINSRLESQERQVNDLSLMVRGGPNIPGLVTEVALIRSMLRDICNSDVCREALGAEAPIKESKDKDDEENVTWKWLVDKAITPIGISFVLWFLLTVLPDLIRHVSTP